MPTSKSLQHYAALKVDIQRNISLIQDKIKEGSNRQKQRWWDRQEPQKTNFPLINSKPLPEHPASQPKVSFAPDGPVELGKYNPTSYHTPLNQPSLLSKGQKIENSCQQRLDKLYRQRQILIRNDLSTRQIEANRHQIHLNSGNYQFPVPGSHLREQQVGKNRVTSIPASQIYYRELQERYRSEMSKHLNPKLSHISNPLDSLIPPSDRPKLRYVTFSNDKALKGYSKELKKQRDIPQEVKSFYVDSAIHSVTRRPIAEPSYRTTPLVGFTKDFSHSTIKRADRSHMVGDLSTSHYHPPIITNTFPATNSSVLGDSRQPLEDKANRGNRKKSDEYFQKGTVKASGTQNKDKNMERGYNGSNRLLNMMQSPPFNVDQEASFGKSPKQKPLTRSLLNSHERNKWQPARKDISHSIPSKSKNHVRLPANNRTIDVVRSSWGGQQQNQRKRMQQTYRKGFYDDQNRSSRAKYSSVKMSLKESQPIRKQINWVGSSVAVRKQQNRHNRQWYGGESIYQRIQCRLDNYIRPSPSPHSYFRQQLRQLVETHMQENKARTALIDLIGKKTARRQ